MKTLKIGISPSLTGKYHIQGIESFKGIELWLKNLKERKTPLKPDLFYYDNKSDPDLIKQIANKLITEDQVDILLGPYSSTLTLEFLKVCKKHNRVLWNYGGSSNDIHNYGYENIISTITEANNYYSGVINLISKNEKYSKKVVILRVKGSNFARNVVMGAYDFANSNGIESSILEFNPGEINFSTHIENIKRNKITNVLCVGSIFDDMNFCEYLIHNNIHKNFSIVATLAASTNEFKKRFGNNSESFISTSQWEPNTKISVDFGPRNDEFLDLYKREYGHTPDYPAAQAYNIGILLEYLVDECSNTNEYTLLNEAKNSAITTFYGDFKVDKSGRQVGHQMFVTQWQDGERKIIFPAKYVD